MIASLILALSLIYSEAEPPNYQVVQAYEEGTPYELQAVRVPVRDMNGEQVLLEEETAEAFMDMMVDAAKDGHYVKVNLGFRTMKQQRYWYRRYQYLCNRDRSVGIKDPVYCGLAARPGHSTHQQGRSVDIAGCTRTITWAEVEKGKNPERYKKLFARKVERGSCSLTKSGYKCKTILFWWLLRNGSRHGFDNSVEKEPWHWTYTEPEEEIGVGG